jgi:two-component system phosphate regulon sensor histidine kinase PhoR
VTRRLSLRGRMVMTAVAASAVALGTLLVLALPALERHAVQQAGTTLAAEARLMARVVEEALARGTSQDALDPVVDAAAREVDARVTIIAADGQVLADSSLSGPALATLENHANRPEVKAAL